MVRKLLFSFLVIAIVSDAFSQHNNSWINYAQEYYKISVAESGVYRLTYTDLEQAGFPVNSVDPRWISIFHRGEEQAIIVAVTGQKDENFDVDEYIEFYGKKNDGTLDQALYISPEDQPHQYYNLYSDTTAYFLTWSVGNQKRMSEVGRNNVDGIVAEPYHWEQNLLVNTEQYATGKSYGNFIQLTDFDNGEGWSGIEKQEGNAIDYTLTGIMDMVEGSSKPIIEVQLVGRDDKQHQVIVSVGQSASSLRVVETANFSLYDTYTVTNEIEWNDISATGELFVKCEVQSASGGNALASVNYIKLGYPQQWDMSDETNKLFYSEENKTGEAFIEISNTTDSVTVIDVTNANTPVIIGYNAIANGISAMLDNTTSKRKLYAYSSVKFPTIEKVNFNNFALSDYDYAIISHKSLMLPGGVYSNPIQAYADYRESEQGGNHNTIVLDIEELFNQYSYGEFSPLAIRDFLQHWVADGNPKALFIIGKSLLLGTSTTIDKVNYNYRKNPEKFTRKDLIPTAGSPGSDLHYGMGLNGNTNELTVPVGRITTSTSEQVAAYLDKVKEHESADFNALWRKNVLHLSGGLSSNELIRFEEHVNGFKSTAEGLYLGGSVSSIRKQSTDAVEIINTTDLINEGLNLITFFGHSAPNIVDIDIGYVSDPVHEYENKGKYPMILVNGCSAGQVFGNNYLWGEDWILTPELGAIGFIAHTYFGYESALRDYSDTFYKKAFGDSSLIYQPIGRVFQEIISQYRADFGTSVLDITQTEQMILVGDPAIHLFKANAPDYAIADNDLNLIPYINGNVDALVDSFAIRAIVRNFGRADNDSIHVRVERRLENDSIIYYDNVISPVFYQDTIAVTIFNEDNLFVGRNRFKLIIDYNDEIPELNNDNNEAKIEINLTLNGTKNLFPSQFAVVNEQKVNLVLQSSNVIGQELRNFLVKIDTINTFDSPYMDSLNVSGEVLLSIPFNILAQDSLVYYWRTKFENPQVGENKDWVTSSFTYIKNGNPGWMQSHRQQVVNDEFNILVDSIGGEFSFPQTEVGFDIKVYGDSVDIDSLDTIRFEIDGEPYMYPGRYCGDHAINLVTFSKYTGIPEPALNPSFWAWESCGRQSQVINNFTYKQIANSGTNSVDSIMLEQYIDNIREGDYVLMFTTGDIQFNNWSPELAAQLERVGGDAATIAALGAGEPYILFGRKGMISGVATEIVATELPYNKQILKLDTMAQGIASSGFVKSTVIGPATTWQMFKNAIELSEAGSIDYYFDIYGIDNNAGSTLMYENISESELDISAINADQTPYLQIKLNLTDSVNQTASQLNYWQVEYESVPEGVLLLGDNSEGYSLLMQEGENFSTNFKFVNVSENDFVTDSLEVIQRDKNLTLGGTYYQNSKIHAPYAGDTTFFTINSDTFSKVGENDYYLEVNNYLEEEHYFDNNSLLLPSYFSVFKDASNPLIQVHFDGRPIVDGAIVSASPIIEIAIWDENPYLFKSDTTGVQLFLKKECEACAFEPIYFSTDIVNWSLNETENRIDIEYLPKQLKNGVYILRVLAEDATGNKLSDRTYETYFEVINEPSLTNFYVFPNPMSNNARFSYQLTGSELPDVIELKILNLEGEVVRYIPEEELGQIRIGNGVTEFNWDGTDQSGNSLPNGVYIYRLTAFLDGVNLVNQQTSSDKGFNKGTGKIYIIR